MFDTMKVARKIRAARVAQNMTQMQLADVMEVSYQAVSNWERGNSMPDISKLTQLGSVLQISLDDLLQNNAGTLTVKKIMRREAGEDTDPVILEELGNVMPLLSPRQANSCIQEALQVQETLDLNAIAGIAPFLDTKFLDSLIDRVETVRFPEIQHLAPFLSAQALDRLVERAELNGDFSQIQSLAPFLGTGTLDRLVERAELNGDFSQIQSLAPFLGTDTLDRLVRKTLLENADGSINIHSIRGLLPFLSHNTLHSLAETMMKHGSLDDLKALLPFC